ncbi:MAG TPA: adenylate/guanylate cyclase domain-containing protein, partial [Casimicrobiaceae bacterium]|nr:adenylate/guanylate cyclase domain-containing protein [Casimicrobiaceae bacterium]
MTSTTHADASTPSLPTGTVTFLFTDIEGSTRLWESQQAAMQAALPRHDALVRACIAHHGGHVFKTGGDAFCAAFHTAPDALAAALESQRAIHAERWPESAKLRVRMALHTGAAELRDGDYFGAPLNRVARLLAAGHGGQTLLSESTHDLCRDHLPPLVTAKALGEHGLKDLARREAVFQLCHPDLPQSFPPLKTTLAPLDREMPSIAVLPFINMSRDEENEYFADGLSEELLNVLAKIRGLRVASRTSAFFFKGKDIDLPSVAQKLNVATVLEGSVRKSGKRVRITAQLIQVATDSHLWSETYDRELEDIFAVQDDIAQSVVTELRAALLGEGLGAVEEAKAKAEVHAAAAGRADNPEAYRLYLQGRYFIERMTQADLARSVDYFRQAIALDPDFALGWTGLSQAYGVQAGYGWAPVAEGYERARDAAKRALAIAPDLAEGHVCLGHVLESHDWDWKGANDEYQRAFALAPGNADVLRAVAGMTRIFVGPEAGVELLRQAVALDPLSSSAHRMLGLRCFLAGRLDEATAALKTCLDLNPKAGLVHCFLCATSLAQGRAAEALELAEREVLPDFRLVGIALARHSLGHKEESDAAVAQLIERHGNEAAYQVAETYAWRGEPDRVFEWLERAYTQRDPGLSMTSSDRFFRPVHDDRRWPPFLKKMGFPSR